MPPKKLVVSTPLTGGKAAKTEDKLQKDWDWESLRKDADKKEAAKKQRKKNRYLYDVCLLPDGRPYFVNKLTLASYWDLPDGGIPCYPMCHTEISILKCTGIEANGQVAKVSELSIKYAVIPDDNKTCSDSIFETPRATKIKGDKIPGWSAATGLELCWDEGSLVFSMVSSGLLTGGRNLGTATVKKSDLLPGSAYRLGLELEQAAQAGMSLEVIIDVAWPDVAPAPPPGTEEASGSCEEEKEEERPAMEADDLVALFEKHDADGNKRIDRDEFRSLLHAIDPSWDEKKSDDLFDGVDADGNGYLDYEEFVNFLFGGQHADKDPPACKYVAKEGEQIFMPDWLRSGQILVRANNRFSFVAKDTHRFSAGVQGRCTLQGRDKAILDAAFFGSKAKIGGAPVYTILLGDIVEGKSGSTGCRACSLPLGVKEGWLQPPSHEKRHISKLNLMSDDGWEADDVVELFELVDKDKSGTIDKAEFAELLGTLIPGCDQAMLDQYFGTIDMDGSENVDYFEFVDFLFSEAGIDRAEDPEAAKYVERKGETVYIAGWCSSARLLVRENGRFSFVWNSGLTYSRGVQGHYTIEDDIISLEASQFGSAATVDSTCSYALRLTEGEDEEGLPDGSRYCVLTDPFPKQGWLFPPSTTPWTPAKPMIFKMTSVLNAEHMAEIFEKIDTDGSGDISKREFAGLVQEYMPGHSLDDINNFMSYADKDGNGNISYAEFIQFIVDGARLDGSALAEPTAGNYVPTDGETLYVGQFNPQGRLLIRSTGTFSYVSSTLRKFSYGVQGRWTNTAETREVLLVPPQVSPDRARDRKTMCTGKDCILQARYFGPHHATEVGELRQIVALCDQLYAPKYPNCKGCLLAVHEGEHDYDWGWLGPEDTGKADDAPLV